MRASGSRKVVPQCGGELGLPGVEVCAWPMRGPDEHSCFPECLKEVRRVCLHGVRHLVPRGDHEAGETVAVRHDSEEEGRGDGLEGVVVRWRCHGHR